MKNFIVLIVIILIAMFLAGCDHNPFKWDGDLAKQDVTITVRDSGKGTHTNGDIISTRGDIVVQHDSMLVQLYSNGSDSSRVDFHTPWGPESTISNYVLRAALYKHNDRINGLRYKARRVVDGFTEVEPLQLEFDLNYGETPIPLDMMYQSECKPNADSLVLHMGTYTGAKWHDTTYVPYGTHHKSQGQWLTVYVTGHADSTSNADHTGLVHNSVNNMNEDIHEGMSIWLASSSNDMEKQKMYWSNEYGGCYKAQIWVLNSIPSCRIVQELYIIELPNWNIKRYGVNVFGTGGGTECIFVRDFDPGPSEWPIFSIVMAGPNGDRPTNLEFWDTRPNFEYVDIIPH